MKKIIAFVCLLIALPAGASPQPAVQETAKLTEDGKFCARIEVRGPAGLPMKKRVCRTLEQWEKAGYTVTAPKAAE